MRSLLFCVVSVINRLRAALNASAFIGQIVSSSDAIFVGIAALHIVKCFYIGYFIHILKD